jgi:hypothetical protein
MANFAMIEHDKMRRSSARQREQVKMRFLIRIVVFLVVAGGLTLLGYAMFSELPAPQNEIVVPVEVR